MDVEELLNYQPSTSIDDAENGIDGPRLKKKRTDEDNTDLDAAGDGPEPLDESALKRLLLQFERKVLKNQELRVKFADQPTKFMDSEVELFEVLQEMHVLSTQPELYRVIVEQKMISTILGLLSHENTDVSCASVGLLQELSDLDNVDEMEDVSVLLDALIDGQVIAQLVSNMDRLDETVKEESEGVYNSLAIVENLTDYKPDLTRDCKQLIAWILKRFKAKMPFDGNKLYASEILSILFQNNLENRKLLGSLHGIDILLQQLAYYKRHDPSSGDEHEFMENLFDCLCASLLGCPKNRELFFRGEGLELMNLVLKEKRKSNSNSSVKTGALKVINHILTTDKDHDDVELTEQLTNRFVELRGLSSLCSILMKPKSIVGGAKKRELKTAIDDIEEHCLSITLSLLKHCKPENRKRIVAKFIESEFEKTERLTELHFKYSEKLNKCDAIIRKEKAKALAEDEELDDDAIFMKRITEGGLFTLQIVDQIILHVCSLHEEYLVAQQSSATESVKARIIKILNMHANQSVNHYKTIKVIAKEFAEELTDETEKKQLLELVDHF
ncbi:Beta-catenin-like protein 1 [Halotydeus destructor]|nr:Beta-catenin-like protein 1 [Halotydeus destructor]